ncbi:MAG: GNAT family N-acetyltransferase [Chloroflexi bacterium]|nr:GNAT family N-acetyltransferase [Chloroflexota bacterium]
MNDAELAACADENYALWWRRWASAIDGGEVHDLNGMLMALTGGRQEWCNVAFVTARLESPMKTIETVLRFFDDHQQPFIMRVREGLDPTAEEVAEILGIRYSDTIPGMALSPLTPPDETLPGLEIRTVADQATLNDHMTISAESFSIDPDQLAIVTPLKLTRQPGWFIYVGYIDHEPVTSSSLLVSGDTAGVYWVGTIATHRRRGLGEAMTWHALREGAKRGASVGVLQASRVGKPIYERMGFHVVSPYRTFVRK